MKKQTLFLLDQIKFLTSKYDLKAKYEYNSDIDIHFVLLYSPTLDLDFVEDISDKLYESFVEEFPKSMVAVMDNNHKYKFRFDILFDNTFNENKINKTLTVEEYDTIIEHQGKEEPQPILVNELIKNLVYSEVKSKNKTTYKNAIKLPDAMLKNNPSQSINIDVKEEEYALAA